MKKSVFIISVICMFTFAWLGIKKMEEANTIKEKVKNVRTETRQLSSELEHMSKFGTKTPTPLNDCYRDFLNHIKLISDYHGVGLGIDITKYKSPESIEQHFKESEMLGVKMLEVKITFFNIPNSLDDISLITSLTDMSKNVSFKITKTEKIKRQLNLTINLYGI